MVNGSLIL